MVQSVAIKSKPSKPLYSVTDMKENISLKILKAMNISIKQGLHKVFAL